MATRTKKTTEPPALPVVPELSDDEKARAQAWFEDKVVRAVRNAGHCMEALRIMDSVFGAPLDKVGVADPRGYYRDRGVSPVEGTGRTASSRRYPAYLDSDGVDCWGNTWRDADGFDRNGLDSSGYDREGFNKDGYDREGFNREGLDIHGLHKDDPARFAFDARGFDKEGYDREGFNRAGVNREGRDRNGIVVPVEDVFVFDRLGYNRNGYNIDGYNRAGEYSEREYIANRAARQRAARF